MTMMDSDRLRRFKSEFEAALSRARKLLESSKSINEVELKMPKYRTANIQKAIEADDGFISVGGLGLYPDTLRQMAILQAERIAELGHELWKMSETEIGMAHDLDEFKKATREALEKMIEADTAFRSMDEHWALKMGDAADLARKALKAEPGQP